MKNLASTLLLLGLLALVACTKDDISLNTDATTTEGTMALMATTTSGDETSIHSSCGLTLSDIDSCFTVVFPVSIRYPDDTEVSYDSLEELAAAVEAWIALASDSLGYPSLVFPIDVVLAGDTEATAVESLEDLRTIVHDCVGSTATGGGHGHHSGGHIGHHNLPTGLDSCYALVFPIDLLYPDSTVTSFTDLVTLETELASWDSLGLDSLGHLSYVFPIEVLLEGDSVNTEVTTYQELREIAHSCYRSTDEGGHTGHSGDHGDGGHGGQSGGHGERGGEGGGHGGHGGGH
jgi:hypothetical protein